MNNDNSALDAILKSLQNPRTIRLQSRRIFDLAKEDQLQHFAFDPEQMTSTASFIIDVITQQYPSLDIPYHSRWRHFEIGGSDRIHNMLRDLGPLPAADLGKILYELVIISVFLDAGAGQFWRYNDATTGQEFSRSEGLALASLALYQSGIFSADHKDPYRVDAQRLLTFTERDLLQGFQVTADNPLEGISGRVALLNRLGEAINSKTQYFGPEKRLGDFYAYVSSLAINNILSAADIFHAVLNAFHPVWPVRMVFHGVSLGDVWTHSALKNNSPGSEYIPFHKLSQWLTYSLIEPLEQNGIQVTELEALTGLPEYRNGGLLIDSGLLRVKNKDSLLKAHDPSSEIIIEWRALTVALLDELATLIRQHLQQDVQSLPLAKILQGGTWEAGRRIAKQKRPLGTPPIQIISDGTVF